MANEASKPTVKSDAKITPEIENDADGMFEEGEFVPLPDETDKAIVSRDARRKIEIYVEKRRLKEQFEDFDDSEFGF
jgi:hypothetical protein